MWENEAGLCSFICDMQQLDQLNGSIKSNSYSMFFIEALLVPPTKFRPAAMAGDSVSICLQNTHVMYESTFFLFSFYFSRCT